MRMRAVLVAAALGVLLAGCTVPRAHDGPTVIPQEIAWRYAMNCISVVGDVGIASLSWTNGSAEVHLDESDDPTIDTVALETEIETCLTKYRYEERVDSFVDAYERSRLYEYYLTQTLPCLAHQGIVLDPPPLAVFTVAAGGEPWNPYLGMELPFDRLLELYRACPPRPASLTGIEGSG